MISKMVQPFPQWNMRPSCCGTPKANRISSRFSSRVHSCSRKLVDHESKIGSALSVSASVAQKSKPFMCPPFHSLWVSVNGQAVYFFHIVWNAAGMRKKAPRKLTALARKRARAERIRNEQLRALIVAAARDGVVGAIEHSRNFWNIDNGYKKYIEHQIDERTSALITAVQTAFRYELARLKPTPRKRRGHR
jgi:hypothetical protein